MLSLRRLRGPFALAAALSLAACDSADLTGPSSTASPVAVTVSGASGGVANGVVGEYGCDGSIWDPKKGRYRDIELKVNLPKKTVDAAGGATHTPQFELRDENDGDRLLMIVRCAIPDVQDPKVEKAYRKVGRHLAKEVRKLQRDLGKAAIRAAPAAARSTIGGVGGATEYTATAQASACTLSLVDRVYWRDGIWINVYDCAGGSGGNDPNGCDANSGDCGSSGGGYPSTPPDECDDPDLSYQPAGCDDGPVTIPFDPYSDSCRLGGPPVDPVACGFEENTPYSPTAGEIDDYLDFLNPSERRLCFAGGSLPSSECYQVAIAAATAKYHAGRAYPDDGSGPGIWQRNDPYDAFRHTLWNAEMTRLIGPVRAKAYADAHEAIPNNPPAELSMDLKNNYMGRWIGTNFPSMTVSIVGSAYVRSFNGSDEIRLWACPTSQDKRFGCL